MPKKNQVRTRGDEIIKIQDTRQHSKSMKITLNKKYSCTILRIINDSSDT